MLGRFLKHGTGRQFCCHNTRKEKPMCCTSWRRAFTLCTIENTPTVPLLVLYVPSVFPEGPRLSRGVSSTKPANSERVSAGLEGAASIHRTARRAIGSAISARFTAARSKATGLKLPPTHSSIAACSS